MFLVVSSAAFVGLVHTLSPAHWLPVVLLVRSHRWNFAQAIVAAGVASTGHIFVSVVVGMIAVLFGSQIFVDNEEVLQEFSGWTLLVLGLVYAFIEFWKHYRCRGHSHHPPSPTPGKRPFVFLFLSGFTPCLAVVPAFLAAAPMGWMAITLTIAFFSAGVFLALVIAATLVSRRIIKLDYEWLEHYGDLIAGVGIAIFGLLILLGVGHEGH